MTDPTTDDDFYRPAPTDFDAKPGTLLRRRAVRTPKLGRVRRAWQVVYATQTGTDTPVPASGIVLTADIVSSAGPEPVLVYCPAFHGLGGRCAPSHLLADGVSEPETGFLAAALERGWTIAIPDGQFLGITGMGPHTFLAGKAAAHTALDLARAVTQHPELEAAHSPCALWGYADGGRAAVWAAEQAPHYTPELDLRAVAAGAVVTDPSRLVPDIDGGLWAGLAVAGFVGLSRAYAHLPVAHLVTVEGERAFETAGSLDVAELLVRYREQRLGQWCEREDPWNDPVWRYVLDNETTARETPQVPVHLYHGTADPLVPVAAGRDLLDEYRSRGAQVSWREYETGHNGAAADGAAEAIARLAAALAPRSTPAT
ncbi:lipase family protein [Nocardia sp. NPDC057227]|uniref:lipase family protein n=1 Tax=Nocardia sp. NPDC057227 TaxID=3346056 RepID=UPI00363087D7